MKALGFDYMATGHYAAIERIGNDAVMKKPKDRRKDQTYFLYSIGSGVLESVLFPLGEFTKEEVRKIAREVDFRLPTNRKVRISVLNPEKRSRISFRKEAMTSSRGRSRIAAEI